MKTPIVLLARRGSEGINKWLGENPLVLGLIFLAIGLALIGSGVYELRKGVAHDKYGNEVRGGLGKATSILRLVAGGGCCLFAIYKLIAG